MPRIEPIEPTQAGTKSKKLLDDVQRRLGMIPNLAKTLAHSPAALAGYVDFNQALNGALTPGLREKIALAVSGFNRCEYCAAVHTVLGSNAGISDEELAANLVGNSFDEKTQAALTFTLALVARQGQISDEDTEQVRAAGFTDKDIVEIVAVVALNVYTNYVNHVAATENDFPKVQL